MTVIGVEHLAFFHHAVLLHCLLMMRAFRSSGVSAVAEQERMEQESAQD